MNIWNISICGVSSKWGSMHHCSIIRPCIVKNSWLTLKKVCWLLLPVRTLWKWFWCVGSYSAQLCLGLFTPDQTIPQTTILTLHVYGAGVQRWSRLNGRELQIMSELAEPQTPRQASPPGLVHTNAFLPASLQHPPVPGPTGAICSGLGAKAIGWDPDHLWQLQSQMAHGKVTWLIEPFITWSNWAGDKLHSYVCSCRPIYTHTVHNASLHWPCTGHR